ncbi:glycosyltransferase [Pseudodesulfovibrio tunisiensis]|uniref:glycosyltransferase n=1 Tax=Pseudodesulfovibrio tunisiensis TaxID=463192 RepID=UPI001FB4FCBF|nr:glycosyltransferase [Pseudodesulfovibrio tunisiensis]
MRILQLAKYYPPVPGGIESVVRDLSLALQRAGHENLVLAHHADRARSEPSEMTGPEGRVVRVSSFGEIMYAPVSPGYPLHLRRLLWDFRPDAVLAHMPNVSAFWPLFVRLSCPLVAFWHADVLFPVDKPLHRLAYRVYAAFERALLARAASIVTTSEPYLDGSVPLHDFCAKCRIVPLGMDPGRIPDQTAAEVAEVRRRILGDADARYVYAAGRFSHYKGFDVLVRAAELARQQLPDLRFCIAGDGETRSEVVRLVREKGLEGMVALPGRVSDREFWALMRGCDCFCLPSTHRTEAFGVVLLEAMSMNRPCVATDIPGSGTAWVNRWNPQGQIVPPEDAQALADALCRVLKRGTGPAVRTELPEPFRMETAAARIADICAGGGA